MEGEETVFFSFIVRKVYCPVSVLQAAHHFSVVFNQCFGGGKEEPRQFLPFQSGFNARAPQFGILSSKMVHLPRTAPPPHRFTPGTGRPAVAQRNGAGGADAPIFKATHPLPSAETEGRALELSHGGPWRCADGSGLVTRC